MLLIAVTAPIAVTIVFVRISATRSFSALSPCAFVLTCATALSAWLSGWKLVGHVAHGIQCFSDLARLDAKISNGAAPEVLEKLQVALFVQLHAFCVSAGAMFTKTQGLPPNLPGSQSVQTARSHK
jgi:hypothetical protein